MDVIAHTFLKYGDSILLYPESTPGYLSSQGYATSPANRFRFTNPNCYIQHQPEETKCFSRNFRDFMFQIQPKLNYDARKDYEETRKFYNRNLKKNKDDKG